MAVADRLIYACKEDTAVLVSLRAWLEEERQKVLEHAIKDDPNRILFHQGAAAKLHELGTLIANWAKAKKG